MKKNIGIAWACSLFFLLTLAFYAKDAAAATIGASSTVAYEENLLDGYLLEGINGPSGAGVSSTGVLYENAYGLITEGHGDAAYGALHAYAHSQVSSNAEARAYGGGYWIDQLTIANSALTGTSAFARASFSLSGVLSSQFSGIGLIDSAVGASVKIDGSYVARIKGAIGINNGVTTLDISEHGLALNGVEQWYPGITGVFTFDIPFVFGREFELFASLSASTRALTGADSAAVTTSNFGSTGYWEGISGVHLADGTELSGYSLSSGSGFDWNNAYARSSTPAVPVPAAAWLFGSGLLGLVGIARRRGKPM